MKIAISSNQETSFVRPLAEGLQRMLALIDIKSKIFPNGLSAYKSILTEQFFEEIFDRAP